MPDAREFWTTERISLLLRLRDDGLAYAAIAARLGVTRSAISGKVDRLGLAARERMPRGPRKPRPILKRRPVAAEPNSVAPDTPAPDGEQPNVSTVTGPFDLAPSVAPQGSRSCSLLDLNEHTCRWPIGDPADADFFFCGELPCGEGPYCSAHRRLAYRPVDPVPVSDFEPARRAALVLQPDTRFGQFAEWDVT